MYEVVLLNFDEAKKELKSYVSMEKSISQMQKLVDDKKESANKLTSTLSGEPKGTSKVQDGMAEKLVQALDIEAELEIKIADMKNKQKEILHKVLLIEQPLQNILFSIYIAGNTVTDACSILGYSRSEMYRKIDKGIGIYSSL